MKKLLPVLGIFAVLVMAYVLVSQSSDEPKPKAKWKIPASETISRIIVERPIPLAEEGREKLIFERVGERWRITEPIQSKVPTHFEKKLVSLFSEPIEMDELELPDTEVSQYGLDESNRVMVEVQRPNLEPLKIEMGLGFRIPETGAKRTYVRSPSGKIYRARTDLGIVFQQPLSLMRDKSLFTMEPGDLSAIIIEKGDDKYRFVRQEQGGWMVAKPEPGFELEQPLFATLERQLTQFRVRGFVTGSPKKFGLDKPDVRVILGTLDGDRRLDIKIVEDEQRKHYYAVLDRGNDVIELIPNLGIMLTGDRNTFRDRLVREIGRGQISRVELAGEAGVVIEQRGPQEWEQVEPTGGKVSPKELGKFLGNLERLSVIRYGDVSAEEAGLTAEAAPSRVVAVANDGTKHVLLLGRAVNEAADQRWARWEDDDEIFVLPQYLYDRFHPGADTLLME